MQKLRVGSSSDLRPVFGFRRSLSRNASGFTIAEVMMAAIVMIFAISSSILVMQRAYRSVDIARNLSYASQIMQSELEKARLLSWAQVTARYPTTSTALAIDNTFSGNPYIGNRFTLSGIGVQMHANTMLKITLTVTWKNFDGRALSRSIETYYGQNGLYDYFSS